MKFKPGVRFVGVRGELVLCLAVADSLFRSVAPKGEDMVVTALVGAPGEHVQGSLHYVGLAADIRLSSKGAIALVHMLRVELGPWCDVILETDHIHIEFQP